MGLKQPPESKLPPLGSWSSSKYPCWPHLLWRANPKPWRREHEEHQDQIQLCVALAHFPADTVKERREIKPVEAGKGWDTSGAPLI